MKIVSTKQFWWRLNYLKRNGGEITVTDRTPEMDVKEFNRIESLVNKSVRWEEEDNAGWYNVIYQGKIHACEVYTEEQPVTSKVLRISCMDVNGRVESRP